MMRTKNVIEKTQPCAVKKNHSVARQNAVPYGREVQNYLLRYPELAPLLPKIIATARREWGAAAELSLELYRDPEIDDSYLTLYVRPIRPDPRIMERIGRIAEAFEGSLARQSGHLLITTDFRNPRGRRAV